MKTSSTWKGICDVPARRPSGSRGSDRSACPSCRRSRWPCRASRVDVVVVLWAQLSSVLDSGTAEDVGRAAAQRQVLGRDPPAARRRPYGPCRRATTGRRRARSGRWSAPAAPQAGPRAARQRARSDGTRRATSTADARSTAPCHPQCAHRRGPELAERRCSARARGRRRRRLMTAMQGAGVDRLALLDGSFCDRAGLVGGDLVLHLHRLDDADELALLDLVALLDEHLPHVALQRGDELVGAAAAAAGLALAALGGPRGRGRAAAAATAPPANGGADDLDVEAPAGDLDGVVLLDRLGASSSAGARACGEGERLQPRLVLEQVAAGLALGPLLGRQQRLVERDQRLEALDLVLAERAQHARGGLLAVGVPDDQLGDHRVVHRRDLAARADAGVDAHARARSAPGSCRSCPGAGAKFFEASSALMRHSIAWPRSTTSSCV